MSVNIALTAAKDSARWPICLTDFPDCSHSIKLALGSGLLDQGSKVDHWRDPLTASDRYQMFLHNVIAGGPNAALANDEGKACGP